MWQDKAEPGPGRQAGCAGFWPVWQRHRSWRRPQPFWMGCATAEVTAHLCWLLEAVWDVASGPAEGMCRADPRPGQAT